jgi:hypothetical protein
VGKGGVVRDPAKRRAALASVEEAARELGFEVLGHAESPIEGPAGNREWLLALRRPGQPPRGGAGPDPGTHPPAAGGNASGTASSGEA